MFDLFVGRFLLAIIVCCCLAVLGIAAHASLEYRRKYRPTSPPVAGSTEKEKEMGKVKLLPQSDVKEVVKFQDYVRDLHSDMPHQDFANKYFDYLGMTESATLKFSQSKRVAGTPTKEK